MTELDRLMARAEIQDLLWRYCRGVDRADPELIKSVYHPGATDDHGIFTGDAAEFADFVVPLLVKTYRVTQHQLANMLIEVDGDRAKAETYFTAYHREVDEPDDAQPPRMVVFGGRYLDELERRDGRWGIVARVVIHDWSHAYRLSLYDAVAAFPHGAAIDEDRSAALFPRGWGHHHAQ
ncbi:MAG TPA: nuclear transport factor 2 family protein [Pseudonocardia sp.]